MCPSYTAWTGLVGEGHSLVSMCAGVGDCDYTTGTCM